MKEQSDFWGENRLPTLRGLNSLQRMMNLLFYDLVEPFEHGDVSVAQERTFDWGPRLEVDETEGHHIYTLDMPGVDKNDLKIEVFNNKLVISGERKEEQRDNDKRKHFFSRRYGHFQRVFDLGAIDASKVEAVYENGVLRVAIPKARDAKVQTVHISESKTPTFQRLEAKSKDKEREKEKEKKDGKIETGGENRPIQH